MIIKKIVSNFQKHLPSQESKSVIESFWIESNISWHRKCLPWTWTNVFEILPAAPLATLGFHGVQVRVLRDFGTRLGSDLGSKFVQQLINKTSWNPASVFYIHLDVWNPSFGDAFIPRSRIAEKPWITITKTTFLEARPCNFQLFLGISNFSN